MRVLLSVVAIAAFAAGALERSEPQCRSLDTACADVYRAVRCGTFEDCIPRWEQLVTPPGNDSELCDTCKRVVQEAKENLLSNMTQDELRQVLEGSCAVLIPLRPFSEMCKQLMDVFQEELVDMLVSRMDPSQVCTVSGLCWRSAKTDVPERASELFLQRTAQTKCTSCKSTVEKAVEIVKFVPQAIVFTGFSRACQNGGFDEVKCDRFAHTYGAKFIHHFKSVAPEKSCQIFGRCQGPVRPVLAAAPVDKLECEFCEAMIHKVVAEFNNTSMKQQVKTALENICKDTRSWAAECQARITADFDVVYDELILMLDPEVLCTLAGICGNSNPSLETLPMARLTPARPAGAHVEYFTDERSEEASDNCSVCMTAMSWVFHFANGRKHRVVIKFGLDEVCNKYPTILVACKSFKHTYGGRMDLIEKENVTNAQEFCARLELCPGTLRLLAFTDLQTTDKKCEICEALVAWIAREVNATSTENEIISVVQKICDLFPRNERNSCRSEVEANGSYFMHLFVHRAEPRRVCSEIRLCSSFPAKPLAQVSEHSLCQDCVRIASYLVDGVNNNRSQENIKAVVEKACEVIPMNVAECQEFIDTNLDRLFDLLRSEVTVDRICRALGVCGSRAAVAAPEPKPELGCHLCTMIARFLEKELKGDRTDAAILAALDKSCAVLPGDEPECKRFRETYGKDIAIAIKKYVNPVGICSAISPCSFRRQEVEELKGDKCSLCGVVVSFLVDELRDNRTDEAIIAALKKVCSVVPGDKKRCQNIIDVYGSIIIQMINEDLSPEEICKATGFCAAATSRPAALGLSRASQKHDDSAPALLGDEQCSFCKWLFTRVEDKLQDNRTKSLIIEELDKACDLISESASCKKMVNTYVDIIVLMLIEYAEPEKICEAIHKCEKPQPKTVEEPCRYCRYIIDEIREDLVKTEAELKQKLKVICRTLPIDTNKCQAFVNQYTDKIVETILAKTDPEEVCECVGVCPKTIHAASGGCKFCQEVVDFVASKRTHKTTGREIVALLEEVCDRVPVIRRENCHRMAEAEGSVIARMIAENLDSASICPALKICPNSLENNLSCTWCQYALHFIQEKLYSNDTQEATRKLLDQMCSNLPTAQIRADCVEFVDTYEPSLEVILAQELDPSIVCPAIHACPAQRAAIVAGLPRRRSSQRCHDCVSTLRSYRRNLSRLCSAASPQMDYECAKASAGAAEMTDAFQNDYETCKYAKSCDNFSGYFSCNRGGCRYIH